MKSKGFAARRGLGARHNPEYGGSLRLPGTDADHRGGGLGEEEGQEGEDGSSHRGHEPRLPGCHGDPRRLSRGSTGMVLFLIRRASIGRDPHLENHAESA